jgi:hypothetical protein
MAQTKNTLLLEVVEIESGNVVHTTNATKQAEFVDRVVAGMLRNMDTERFFIREVWS